jgi:hypothetical protein
MQPVLVVSQIRTSCRVVSNQCVCVPTVQYFIFESSEAKASTEHSKCTCISIHVRTERNKPNIIHI